MNPHFTLIQDLSTARQNDLIRAADNYRLASAASGSPRPGTARRWLGTRLVALGQVIASQPASSRIT
jgi:hypothetical protein